MDLFNTNQNAENEKAETKKEVKSSKTNVKPTEKTNARQDVKNEAEKVATKNIPSSDKKGAETVSKSSDKPVVKTGLGDVIENITDSLGITKCEPCEERKKRLNDYFPFTRKSRKPTSEDISFFNKCIKSGTVKEVDKKEFSTRYKRIFRKTFTHCNCIAKYNTAFNEIKTIVEYFKQIENA